jgi:hypothetical protein
MITRRSDCATERNILAVRSGARTTMRLRFKKDEL